ncbi:hypothetical protein ABEY55_22030 [Priestia aryabhattai]|uniref:hypothetical protein n=1 Tax=Priestia aryabhattai TaxID=412384 RepID=UPI003D26713A
MSWKELFRSRVPIQILSGGHVLTDKQIPAPITSASIAKGDNPGEVFTYIPFGSKLTWKLTGIEWEESSTRSAGKAAAGAIAGTVVAGPIGTIAGAAIGGKKKDTSKAFVYLVGEDSVEHTLHIRCDQKQYIQIASYIG